MLGIALPHVMLLLVLDIKSVPLFFFGSNAWWYNFNSRKKYIHHHLFLYLSATLHTNHLQFYKMINKIKFNV